MSVVRGSSVIDVCDVDANVWCEVSESDAMLEQMWLVRVMAHGLQQMTVA